jgi:O-antigen/teichoic acid export membrane protein
LVGLLICALPLTLVMVIGGPFIITTLYGPDFAPAGPVFQIFGLILLAMYLNIFCAQLLAVMDRQRIWAIVLVVATIAAVPVNWFLISWAHSFGQASNGAAFGLLVTELAQTVPGFIILSRLQLRGVIQSVLGKGLLALVVAGACGWPLASISPILATAVALIVYAGACWQLRLISAEELGNLRALAAQALASRLRGKAVKSAPAHEGS